MHLISIDGDRPDFRVFIDLLFGADSNVDTDGNSSPVNSRIWTYLYIADRHGDRLPVVIEALDDQLAVFRVESKSERLEQLAALYLFDCCGSGMATQSGPMGEAEIAALKNKFAHEIDRAAASLWHQSSDVDPYPNLAARR